jgi:ATP-dependent HslUV protease ATP-binding subunit HslU
MIELDLAEQGPGLPMLGAMPGMDQQMQGLQDLFGKAFGGRKVRRRLTVADSYDLLIGEEADKLLDDETVTKAALAAVQDGGIVFIDEIDKVCARSDTRGADVSREGVQRDLLPLIEGCTVNTKLGMVKTDHILFIASGAFHLAKPSDLVPELQGRLPIRVELKALSPQDFERILTGTDACLTRQYEALLKTEDVALVFQPDAVRRLAEIAWQVNEKTENIGARRLHTVMEKLLEEISFNAGKHGMEEITIDQTYVEARLGELAKSEDLARYVL